MAWRETDSSGGGSTSGLTGELRLVRGCCCVAPDEACTQGGGTASTSSHFCSRPPDQLHHMVEQKGAFHLSRGNYASSMTRGEN